MDKYHIIIVYIAIIIIVQCADDHFVNKSPSYFETYEFNINNKDDWNWTTTDSNTVVEACTSTFSNLCIKIDETKPGFLVKYNDKSYDFLKNEDWSQITTIYSAKSMLKLDKNPIKKKEKRRLLRRYNTYNTYNMYNGYNGYNYNGYYDYNNYYDYFYGCRSGRCGLRGGGGMGGRDTSMDGGGDDFDEHDRHRDRGRGPVGMGGGMMGRMGGMSGMGGMGGMPGMMGGGMMGHGMMGGMPGMGGMMGGMHPMMNGGVSGMMNPMMGMMGGMNMLGGMLNNGHGNFGHYGFPSLTGNMMGMIENTQHMPPFMKIPPNIHINADLRRLLSLSTNKDDIRLMKCFITSEYDKICVLYNLIDSEISLKYIINNNNNNNDSLKEIKDKSVAYKQIIWNNINTKCNDILFSFFNYSICISKQNNNNAVIYFKRKNDEIDHNKMINMIINQYDSTRFNIMDDMDWTEIYEYNYKNVRQLCNYLPMIQLCVKTHKNEVQQVSVQLLSL